MVQKRAAVNVAWTGLYGAGACSSEYGVEWTHVVQKLVAVSVAWTGFTWFRSV